MLISQTTESKMILGDGVELQRPKSVAEERRAIAAKKNGQLNPTTLIAALKKFLDQETLDGDIIAAIADMQFLNCIPEEAKEWFVKVLAKHPPKLPPSRLGLAK